MRRWFSRFAMASARAQGHWLTFTLAVGLIIVWLLSGPLFRFGNTWQLVINTATTIITFLGVFLVQHAQNKGDEAIHLKLDELLRAVQRADDAIIDVEDEDEDEITRKKQAVVQAAREG